MGTKGKFVGKLATNAFQGGKGQYGQLGIKKGEGSHTLTKIRAVLRLKERGIVVVESLLRRREKRGG